MKNDREWSEPAEQQVAEALNGNQTSFHIEMVSTEIKKQLEIRYPSEQFVEAKWIGGEDYGNVGDVSVSMTTSVVPVELKFSKAKGRGTGKNVSAKIFNKKISDTILTYPEHDDMLGLKQQRYALIESLTGKTFKRASHYENELRTLRDTKPEVLDQIEQITTPGQESYAAYVAEKCNQYLTEVNDLVKQILNKDRPDKNVLYCVIRNYESDAQTVQFMDFNKDNVVTKVVASGKSIKFLNSKGKDIVRFSVHWKNICQGGKTPCFNVFIGNEY